MQAIGDVRIQLEEWLSGKPDDTPALNDHAVPTTVGRRATVIAVSIAVVISAAIATLATWTLARSKPASSPLTRFTITFPANQQPQLELGDRDLVLSPDGTRLVYVNARRQFDDSRFGSARRRAPGRLR